MLWSPLGKIPSKIVCNYTVMRPNEAPARHHVTVSPRDLIPKVVFPVMHNVADTKKRLTNGHTISIGVNGNWHLDDVSRMVNLTKDPVTLYAFGDFKNSTDLFCFEMFARSYLFEVLLPLGVGYAQVPLQSMGNNYPELESFLNMPVIMPSKQIMDTFNDKKLFANWMVGHGFEKYIPRTFASIRDITYPCMLKQTDGVAGIGSYLVTDTSSLAAAMTALSRKKFVMQEAILGSDETTAMAVARNGRLLGVFCVTFHKEESLYVRDGFADDGKTLVDCAELERVSAVITIIRDIVQQSGYNGLFGINFKLERTNSDGTRSPMLTSEFTPDVKLGSYAVMSDFARLGQTTQPVATPKFFEINPRICGPMAAEPVNLRALIRLYIEAL